MSATRLLAALAFGLLVPGAAAAAARGIGATFPQPAYARWAALFAAATGETVAYEGANSDAGLRACQDPAEAFGASDVPLDADQLRSQGLIQVPTLVGGIVPVVDLPGVGPGDLVLDAPALAGLFLGRIAFWDDPEIRRSNPRLPLPHLAVTAVRRSDRSGSTEVFAAYLATAPRLSGTPLGESPPALPAVGLAVAGSEGVARAVAATPGAVGYLGFDHAQARRMAYVDLVNPAGRVVQPTLESVAAAAAAADWSRGLAPSLVARDGGASWPIVTASYVLMRRVAQDAAAAGTALRFIAWASRYGGPAAEDLGFVSLPREVETEVRRRLGEVRGPSGAALAPQP